MAQPEDEGYTRGNSGFIGGVIVVALLLLGGVGLYMNGTLDQVFASKPVATATH